MSYVPFKDVGGFDQKIAMFVIWLKTGNAHAFPYFSMLDVSFDPSVGIVVPFATKRVVTLCGRGLLPLFQKLVRHEVLEIFEANRAELPGATVVESVVIK